MKETNGKVVIATHSTTVVSSLFTAEPDTRIAFKHFGAQQLEFRQIDDAFKSVLPMFGAHPLSNVFNEKPPLIVEGEDDERIWQAAVRHSQGRISVYPCVAGDIQSINKYERVANDLMRSVYDSANAYSLRDGDEISGEIDDFGLVVRFRLQCRSAENLLITDDVLDILNTNWIDLKANLEKWIDENSGHSRYNHVVEFRESGWDRKEFNLKNLRSLLVSFANSSMPWEVAVGRAIANLRNECHSSEHNLASYLGRKLVNDLVLNC